MSIYLIELEKRLPKELVGKLFFHYSEIKNHFRLGRHENNELNGSKYCEIVFRILEHIIHGHYTPLGKQIKQFTDQCRKFEFVPSTSLDDTIRIHIPRTLILIVDIRNKRGVGHVSGIHNPNLLDATLVTKCCDWVMAEILRIFAGLDTNDAQQAIESIIKLELPVVEKIGETRRVLDTDLPYADQVLVLLYNEYPKQVNDEKLFEWTEYSNLSKFRNNLLQGLHSRRFIEYNANYAKLLTPGIKDVEERILVK
jgi:hypothetical protein